MRNHWELPIYDADGYFVANEIDRYSLNSYMLDRGELQVEDGRLVSPSRPTDRQTLTRPATGCPRRAATSASPRASTDPTPR